MTDDLPPPRDSLNPRLPRAACECVRFLRVIAHFCGRNFTEAVYMEIAQACDLPRLGLVKKAFGGSWPWALVAAGVGDPPPGVIPRTPFRLKGKHLIASDQELVEGMALGVRLKGHWVTSDKWSSEIARPFRDLGYPVPYRSQIERRLRSWERAVDLTDALLRMQQGANAPERLLPSLSASERVARRMAAARDRLGYWPNSEHWDKATKPLRDEGMKVPVYSNVLLHFESWSVAVATAEMIGGETGSG